MNGVLQQMANRLDLAKVQEQAAISNDLLPPREDDHVTGELGKRFVAHLLSRGTPDGRPAGRR